MMTFGIGLFGAAMIALSLALAHRARHAGSVLSGISLACFSCSALLAAAYALTYGSFLQAPSFVPVLSGLLVGLGAILDVTQSLRGRKRVT